MVERVFKYFPDLDKREREQLQSLKALYSYWNERVNLISRKDIENLYLHHILHSMAISKVIEIKEGDKIIDIGTGGGFPGIPLAILHPQSNFLLCDSRGKKIDAVANIVKEIGLENVTTKHSRVEQLKGQYHFGVTRAVASTRQLVEWSRDLIIPSNSKRIHGLVALKGLELSAEIEESTSKCKIERARFHLYKIEKLFEEEWFKEKGVLFVEL